MSRIQNVNDDSRTGRDDATKRCSNCGGAIDADEWHPATTVRGDDGDVEIYCFCSETCQSAWEPDK